MYRHLGLCKAITKKSITCATEVPEGNKVGAEKIFKEIMAEIFPNLTKDINLQKKK